MIWDLRPTQSLIIDLISVSQQETVWAGLISPVVKQDTRMSNSFEAFNQATRSDRIDEQPMSLHKFAVERRKFLLDPKGE